MRIGLGTDRHRLEAGRPLVLGGVTIPADVGCVAHSDGDVLLHALTDALLGAVAAGDIGALFPDTDPAWKDAASDQFVRAALERARDAGFQPVNVDATIHLQRVRLAPHRDAIRASVAALLQLPEACVSVKAKTGERVGPVGRGESIDALVVALLEPVPLA